MFVFLLCCLFINANIEYDLLYSSEIELGDESDTFFFIWPVSEKFIKTIIFTNQNQATIELTEHTYVFTPQDGIVKEVNSNSIVIEFSEYICEFINIKEIIVKKHQIIKKYQKIGKSKIVEVKINSTLNIQNLFPQIKNSKIKINKLTLV